MKQLNVTELDFDAIKENLKDYFRNVDNGEYSDWDFEGSGLSHLLDVLAYNTHYNAVVAHNAMNESFLDSAQIRSNVVSRAKLLGYTPKSQTAPMAKISLTFPSAVNRNLSTYTLTKGQSLTSAIDGVTYTFITRDDYTAVLDEENRQYVFDDVVIYQGRMKESSYVVETGNIDQKYIIEDNTVDLDHLLVDVYDNQYSTAFESYARFKSLAGVGPSTAAYFINENYNGNYEIKFGDNIFGKKPSSLNIIKIRYLSTKGPNANGANVFEWASPGSVSPTIVTLSSATNGSIKEDVETIRHNAPLSFTSQNRAVTSTDYKVLIQQILNNIETVSVWGGEDNNPPQYGKVYASIKPFDSEKLTDLDKDFLLRELIEKRVIGIEPVLIDPEYTYLYFDIMFKYDSNRTSFSPGQLSTKVEEMLEEFNVTNLQKFDGVFRYSKLLSHLDNLDVSIVNSFARVYLYKRVTFEYGKLLSTPVDFQLEIYGEIDQKEPMMASDSWVHNNIIYRLEDEPITGSVEERNVYAYHIGANGNKKKLSKSVGTLNMKTGLVSINPLPISKTETINIYVTPASNDVVSKRNKLISIDIGRTNITPEVDTIVVSGSSGVDEYTPFLRHRPDNT